MIQFMIPYPPSVNHYYKRNKFGGIRVGDDGKEFRDDVAVWYYQSATSRHINSSKVLYPDGKLNVTITAYFPDNRKRDIDNILKATLDAITHIRDYKICESPWSDDSQIYKLTVVKVLRKDHNYNDGCVDIMIKAIDEEM